MNQAQTNQSPNQPAVPPQPAPPKYRCRWAIVAVLLTIVAFFWLRSGIQPSFQFEDILEYFNVRDEGRCVRLAYLAVALITITLIVKHVMSKNK